MDREGPAGTRTRGLPSEFIPALLPQAYGGRPVGCDPFSTRRIVGVSRGTVSGGGAVGTIESEVPPEMRHIASRWPDDLPNRQKTGRCYPRC